MVSECLLHRSSNCELLEEVIWSVLNKIYKYLIILNYCICLFTDLTQTSNLGEYEVKIECAGP